MHIPNLAIKWRVATSALALSIGMCFARAADAAPAEFLELSTHDPSGVQTIVVNGLGDLPNPQFATANLRAATSVDLNLKLDPTPDEPLALAASGAAFTVVPSSMYQDPTFTFVYSPRFLFAEVPANSAPRLRLYVGADVNGDKSPQTSEILCENDVVAGTTARCVVDLATIMTAHPAVSNVWIAVDVPQGTAGTTYSASLEYAAVYMETDLGGGPANGNQFVSGPGHASSDVALPLRYSWGGDLPLAAGQRYFGAILADPNPTDGGYAMGTALVLPFAITRTGGSSDDVPLVVVPDQSWIAYETGLIIGPGQTLRHAFVDVPPNAQSLNLASGSATPFSIVRIDFPAPSESTNITPAPTGSSIASTLSNNQQTLTINTQSGLESGRWYVVMSGNAQLTGELATGIGAVISYSGAAPAQKLGSYYNPARSGAGIFLSQAGGNQVLTWYSYMEDGTPTWYIAEGLAPKDSSQSVWESVLYRTSWNGGQLNAYMPVGWVVVTAIADNEIIFSYQLEGRWGSEHMYWLGWDTCPELNRQPVGVDGNWYPPALSGSGMDLIAGADTQFSVHYIYDDLGWPRWVYGSGPFASSSTLEMDQTKGPCPFCEFVPMTQQRAGSATLTYADAINGGLQTAITFLPPLSGTWNVNLALSRLTGSVTCAR